MSTTRRRRPGVAEGLARTGRRWPGRVGLRWPRGVRWRHLVVTVLLVACAVPVVGGLARIQLDTSVSSFLPPDDPALRAIEAMAPDFGADPVVVLLESAEPRQLLIDHEQLPKLADLEGRLAQLPDVTAVYGPGTVVNQIARGARNVLAAIGGRREVVVQLAEEQARRANQPPEAVAAAGRQALEEFNRRYGELVVRGLPAGLPTVYNPGFVQSVIFDESGAPDRQWRFVVPSPTSVAIVVRPRSGLDEAGNRELAQRVRAEVEATDLATTRVTVTGVPVVSAALAERIRADAPLLAGLAVVGCAAVLLTIPRRGARRARLWPLAVMSAAAAVTLSSLGWLGQPVSLGVLALLPILLGIGANFPLYLTQGADRRRVLVSGLACAAAAACLVLCPLPIVRLFGVTLAAAIALVILLSLALRSRLAPADADPPEPGPTDPGPADEPRASRAVPARRPARVLALLAAAAVAAAGWVLLPKIEVAADPERLAAGLSAMDDARHVASVMGSSAELTVLVHGEDVLRPEVLAWQRQATDAIVSAYGDRARPVIGAADYLRFLGENPTPGEIDAANELLPAYLTSSVIRSDRRESVLVFGMDLEDIADQRVTIDGIRSALPPPPPGIEVDVVGLPVAAARAYEIVADSRYLTNTVGIAAAGVVLALGLRRRTDAARAILAGVLATGWGLAILWAVGADLTPLTVTLGALTTVVGCEFLVMLAEARRRGSRAVLWSVGTACANSSIAYLVLTASGIDVVRDFGLVLLASVVLAYLSALLVVTMLPPRRSVAADPSAPARPAPRPTRRVPKEVPV